MRGLAFRGFSGVFAALLLAACGSEAVLDALPTGGRAQVAAALAGDTVRLEDGRLVRLAGIEAPGLDQPYGAQAQAALADMVLDREVELLLPSGEGGDGAPLIAQLREASDRRWVEASLLRAGAARVRTRPEDQALAEAMLAEEARARIAGRGLWALSAYQVRLPQEVVAERPEGFQLVEGRVLRVAENAGRLYLEFSPDWRGGFSAEAPLRAEADFAAAGVQLRSLEGRLVRLRGPVRPTGYGPRLELDHPAQIEILRAIGG